MSTAKTFVFCSRSQLTGSCVCCAVLLQGGFVACSSQLRALLLNRGRSVIYSTALPVPVVAAARAALRISRR
jgi:7-keto-8-aminopelargonate synthetase-like enzyme